MVNMHVKVTLNFIILNDVLLQIVMGLTIKVRLILFFSYILINILDDNYANLKMRLEENIDLSKSIPSVSVSIVKRDTITLDEGNPGIKPPNYPIGEEKSIISLLKLENNEICIRRKTTEMKNGSQLICVRSQPPLITHHSSISQQSILLNETELTQDSPKPDSANNNSQILSVRTHIERVPKKIKLNKIYLDSSSGILKNKNIKRLRVKHVYRENLL